MMSRDEAGAAGWIIEEVRKPLGMFDPISGNPVTIDGLWRGSKRFEGRLVSHDGATEESVLAQIGRYEDSRRAHRP